MRTLTYTEKGVVGVKRERGRKEKEIPLFDTTTHEEGIHGKGC